MQVLSTTVIRRLIMGYLRTVLVGVTQWRQTPVSRFSCIAGGFVSRLRPAEAPSSVVTVTEIHLRLSTQQLMTSRRRLRHFSLVPDVKRAAAAAVSTCCCSNIFNGRLHTAVSLSSHERQRDTDVAWSSDRLVEAKNPSIFNQSVIVHHAV